MVIRFVHAASLLFSLLHFVHEGGAHPHHAHANFHVLFGHANNRRSINRAF